MSTRRARIIETATRLIQQHGYERTSVDDVIREAGLSGKSHFYHYFRSKEVLGYEVLEHQFERFTERGLALLREPTIDPRERLGLFIDAVVVLQEREGGGGASAFGASSVSWRTYTKDFAAGSTPCSSGGHASSRRCSSRSARPTRGMTRRGSRDS